MAVSKWSSCSNEELLQMIRNLAEKLGRSPKKKEMGSSTNTPGVTVYLNRFKGMKWNDILLLCDLDINKTWRLSKEDGLKLLREAYVKLGRNPILKDFKENSKELGISTHWIFDNFDSMEDALFQSGIIKDKPLTEEERFKATIKEITELKSELNRLPFVKEYKENRINGYEPSMFKSKFNLTYNEFCLKYINNAEVNLVRDVTKEDIILELKKIYNSIGHAPKQNELKKLGFTYDSSIIYRKFNKSYNQVIRDLGWEPTGWQGTIKTDEELLNEFYDYFKQIKRIPTVKDITQSNLSSYETYKKRFGSIGNICELLNIDGSLYFSGNGIGRICFDLNKEICRSIKEKYISDLLITNKVLFKKETSYNEFFNGDLRRFDWKININNKIYYIEYAGLYARTTHSKINKLYNKKIKKKIRDLYKINKLKDCMFIFQWDFDSNLVVNKISKFLNVDLNDIEFVFDKKTFKNNDLELLNELMLYSKADNYLPTYTDLNKLGKKYLYNEVLTRYGTYYNFASKYNKHIHCKPRNYWDLERIYDCFNYMELKYYDIYSPKQIKRLNINDTQLDGYYHSFQRKNLDNFNTTKLNYLYNKVINNEENLLFKEIEWIENVVSNSGTGIKDKFSDYEIARAIYIFNNLNNIKEYIKEKNNLNQLDKKEFVSQLFSCYDYMCEKFNRILTRKEIYKYNKNDKLLYISNMFEKVRKYFGSYANSKTVYYKYYLNNNIK